MNVPELIAPVSRRVHLCDLLKYLNRLSTNYPCEDFQKEAVYIVISIFKPSQVFSTDS